MAKKKPGWRIRINGKQESVLKGQAEQEAHLFPESEEGKKCKGHAWRVRFNIETATRRIPFNILPRSADDAKLTERDIEELRWGDDSFWVRFKNGSVYQGKNNSSCRHEKESAPRDDFEDTWDVEQIVDDQTLRIQYVGGEIEPYEFARVKIRRTETDGRFLKWVYICEGLEIDITPRQEKLCQDSPIEDPDYHPVSVMQNPCEPRGLPDRVGLDNQWYLARFTNGAMITVYPPVFRKRQAAAASEHSISDSSEGVADQIKSEVKAGLEPHVDTFKKATLLSTPALDRQWWQNLRAAYYRESGPLEKDKWLAVAHMVVIGATVESSKLERDPQSDYLTPLMLRTLIRKLNSPGANRAKIEGTYAETLRRTVQREEGKSAPAAK
jgi:hypothetical protein